MESFIQTSAVTPLLIFFKKSDKNCRNMYTMEVVNNLIDLEVQVISFRNLNREAGESPARSRHCICELAVKSTVH